MKLSILGSGVIGQATGVGFSKCGHDVVFYDIDDKKLAILEERGYNVSWSLLSAVQSSDIIFVCVPTPTVDGLMDFGIIENVLVGIGEALNKLRKYRVVVVRSTVLPLTTRCKVVPLLEKYSKLTVGDDFGVCMNPEFLRDKSALQDFLNPNKIVIGEFDKRSGDFLEKVYSSFKAPVIRTDLDSAEMIKYASNLFLATKISFFNEMYIFCQKLGVDSEFLGKAVSLDPRIGEYGVYGGRSFNGKCLPKDLEAFRSFVKSLDVNPKLLDAVSFVNNEVDSLKKRKNRK
ncbi:UDP-glucose/GDP-mannose dehydrogenase family protein [bacterium]|nr:MAG: UDP-glucose/GDP-mannose dehydrogenase family protein [bacterium]